MMRPFFWIASSLLAGVICANLLAAQPTTDFDDIPSTDLLWDSVPAPAPEEKLSDEQLDAIAKDIIQTSPRFAESRALSARPAPMVYPTSNPTSNLPYYFTGAPAVTQYQQYYNRPAYQVVPVPVKQRLYYYQVPSVQYRDVSGASCASGACSGSNERRGLLGRRRN